MVPAEIADRWGKASTMGGMMQILHGEKDPLTYPADDLVDEFMLPLIRPDVSNLTAANLKLLDRTALDVFKSTLHADEAESIAQNTGWRSGYHL